MDYTRSVYFPASEVVHIGGQSIRANFTEMLVISQQSLFYLFQKHFGRGHLQALRLLTAIEMVLRSALWGIGYGLTRSRREERRQRLKAYGQIFYRTLAERSYWSPSRKEER